MWKAPRERGFLFVMRAALPHGILQGTEPFIRLQCHVHRSLANASPTWRRFEWIDRVLAMRMDVFVVGKDDGYVVAPIGATLPDEEMSVLGELHFGWVVDSDATMSRLDWQGIVKDIDARGYSIVPQGDVAGLLGVPQHELSALYPEFHLRFAA
jgi:hypothetical protein